MKPAILATEIEPEPDFNLPEPFASRVGAYRGRSLGDHFGLTGIGVRLETIEPGSQSALRHWHTLADELVYVLEGELTLVTGEGESPLRAGMCAGFKAGVENGHHLVNRSREDARILVAGARVEGDRVHYPDDDFQWLRDGGGNWHAARRDGTPY